MQTQGRRSRDERPRKAGRESFQRRSSAGWTTDAKISAGVLGALAALCLGVVGWRFVESRYFGSTPVAGGSAIASIAAPSKSQAPEAIYAVPQIGHGSDGTWSRTGSDMRNVPAAAGFAASDRLPAPSNDQVVRQVPAHDAEIASTVATGRFPLPPQSNALPAASSSGVPTGDEVAIYQSAAYVDAGGTSSIDIQPGDSFWLISERAYGSGAYFKALYRFHEASIAEPDRLPAGQRLEIPSVETLRELFPEDVPNDTSSTEVARLRPYRTKRGDTALSVAQSQLGDASRWTEVFRLNQRAVASPDALLPEHYELKLPPAPRMAAAPADGRSPVAPIAPPAVR